MSQACSVVWTGSLVSRYQGSRPLPWRTTTNHNWPRYVCVSHRESEHPRAAIDSTMRIPEQSRLSPGAFAARHLPGFALLPPSIDEFVAFLPAHHKAQQVAAELPEAGTVARAAIKDVAHLASPALGRLTQQDLLLLARLSRH